MELRTLVIWIVIGGLGAIGWCLLDAPDEVTNALAHCRCAAHRAK